jgi:hypothetical protein
LLAYKSDELRVVHSDPVLVRRTTLANDRIARVR